MNRTLIVARMRPDSVRDVARIWAESDSSELPALAGVSTRELYVLGDAYIHLLETEKPGGAAIAAVQGHTGFKAISEQLSDYIDPYLATWQRPADAQASLFYRWTPTGGPVIL